MDTLRYVVEFVVGTAVRFAPLFFLSIGLAAVVKSLPIARVASRWLARRERASVVAGSALGAFSPFCSCTVVPVVRSLLVAGAPLAGVMAFWVASPLMDPEIFLLSVGLLGWDIAVARLLAALALALAAGFGAVVAVRRGWLPSSIASLTTTSPATASPVTTPAAARAEEPALVGAGVSGVSGVSGSTATVTATATALPSAGSDCCETADAVAPDGCCDPAPGDAPAGGCGEDACSTDAAAAGDAGPRGVVATLRSLDWSQVRRDFLDESWHIGRWILLAFALEALILLYVPQEAMVAVLGQDAPWAVPLAALLGIPLYMDSFSALPVISGLLEQGMAPGAAIAFLLAGPVTTIPAMTAVRAVLPGPVFRYYLAVSVFGSMALGLVVDLVL